MLVARSAILSRLRPTSGPIKRFLEVRDHVHEVGLGGRKNRPRMWRLFLVIERDRHLFVHVPGKAGNGRGDIGIGITVGCEAVPSSDDAERKRGPSKELKRLRDDESGKQAPGAVEFRSWSGNSIQTRIATILTSVPLAAE